uniref:Uncharacterized protein n=1 Tax=Anguilla anguilla TaxID=7936 RepID=A0A0E9SPQ5_ANGAN
MRRCLVWLSSLSQSVVMRSGRASRLR